MTVATELSVPVATAGCPGISAGVRADRVTSLVGHFHPGAACTVRAAEEAPLHLNTVAQDAALAVLATRREFLRRALKGIEHVHVPTDRVYLETHPVVVAARLADRHVLGLPHLPAQA